MANVPLLNCPFCGKQPVLHQGRSVRCETSGCLMTWIWPDIAQWNTRAAAPQPPAPNEIPPAILANAQQVNCKIDLEQRRIAHATRPAPNESTPLGKRLRDAGFAEVPTPNQWHDKPAVDPAPGDLLPCPFCAGPAYVSTRPRKKSSQIRCSQCQFGLSSAEKWNRRAALTAQAARIAKLQRERDGWESDHTFVAGCLRALEKKYVAQSAQLAEARAKYNELIMAVAKKFPGESRHETALRYINQAETPQVNTPQVGAKLTEGGK